MKKKVKVRGPYSVDYGGELHVPGDLLDMDQGEARRLIKKGIVAEAAEGGETAKGAKAKAQKPKGKK